MAGRARRAALVLAIAAAALGARAAQVRAQAAGPTATYKLGGDAYAGLPFVLAVVVDGFDETPAPTAPPLAIPNARVDPMGVQHQPAPTLIVNGQRIDQGGGTWVIRYRIDVDQGGTYTIPSVTVTQGGKQAIAQSARLKIAELATTRDMAIEVVLPDRPVYVGETVPVEIAWDLTKNPRDPTLSVPLLAMEDALAVTAPPPADQRRTLTVPAGGRDLELGFEEDAVDRGGVHYTRLRFPILITPLAAGPLTIPPAQVVARLETGMGRDAFGFPTPRSELFRAVDVARTLDVRPLPESGKPSTFAGAVGSAYSIGVRTSRSVVQLGEPVELEITVKSDRRLDTVGLPPLDGPGGLPRGQFAVPADPPVGELSDDGLAKTFKVAVQVVSDRATEIPALAFSYFDPLKTSYQTIHSEPIALSVKGGSVVGAAQVQGGDPSAGSAAATGPVAVPGQVSLVGVDLALSSPDAADGGPLSRNVLWSLVAILYLVPLLVLGARVYRSRTAARREEAGEARGALRALRDALGAARSAPGKQAAVALPRALHETARALGRTADADLIARIENAGFAPDAGDDPLPSELLGEVADVIDAWARPARGRGAGPGAVAVTLLICLGAPRLAHAEDPVAIGRAQYQAALAATDPVIRQRNFAAAAASFAQAAHDRRAPALYTDWGNAALGAGDLGGAALAYRRALTLDRADGRARRNLGWLRSRLPEEMRPRAVGATETLFFFHRRWSRDRRWIVGGLGFAAAVLLLVPWGGRRRRGLMTAAALPALVWVTMLVSLAVEDRHRDDAVVMQSLVLRVADSPVAPAAMASPLPAGVEVTALETRGDWTRIRLPSGATGWLPAGAVERVVERSRP